jgi:hypothetical protein
MVRRTAAALITALLVAACGSGSHSTSMPAARSSSAAAGPSATTAGTTSTSTTTSQASSSAATSSHASSSSSASSTHSSSSTHAARHTHTQPPPSTPHFLFKLKIGPGGTLTPPGVAIGGHTLVDLSATNASGAAVRFEIAHGAQPVYTRTLPSGQTTAKLPALKNATYTVLVDGKPRGTLTIGAKAGP